MSESLDQLVRLNDAARALGLTVQTVRKYCQCGVLACERLPGGHWRVYRSALEEILSKKRYTTREN